MTQRLECAALCGVSIVSLCDCVLTHVNNDQGVKVTRSLQRLVCQEKARTQISGHDTQWECS